MARIIAFTVCLSLASMAAGPAFASAKRRNVHQVARGETLWSISRAYGCSVDELQRANRLQGVMLRPGQSLEIPACGQRGSSPADEDASEDSDDSSGHHSEPADELADESADESADELAVITHFVAEGDTLGHLAKRYDTTVKDIRRRNGLDSNLIRPGQKLHIPVGERGQGRAIPGQSVGMPSRGMLVNGMQLPAGKGYYRRRPHHAWGANHTIFHIRRAVAAVRADHPKVHDVAIGDISSRQGGPLSEHKSHQSGRDVDIGLYFNSRPKGYPQTFIRGNAYNLDLAANFALLKAFADTADSPTGVEKMFLNYELQELLYKWGQDNRVPQSVLDQMFQYPDGEYAAKGMIRHEPGHDTHVHVRFKCPEGDSDCQ